MLESLSSTVKGLGNFIKDRPSRVSFETKFKSSHSQIFFKIDFFESFLNFTWKHLTQRTWVWIFKNTFSYRISQVTASDSFRFPACNFIKKDFFIKKENFAKIWNINKKVGRTVVQFKVKGLSLCFVLIWECQVRTA